MKISIKQISALEKVFLNDRFDSKKEYNEASALGGEKFSYQIMFCEDRLERIEAKFKLTSDLNEYIRVYSVGNVPSEMPCMADIEDDDYITKQAGLIPDVLIPIESDNVLITQRPRAIWIDIKIPENHPKGKYKINFELCYDGVTYNSVFCLKILDANLPEQKTIYTQWLHSDCISDYFNVKVFSKKYWEITEKYIKEAAESGINMILAPIFTPPLDTDIGAERKTVQLVDISLNDGIYSFDFKKFKKWIKICKKNNIKYFEISPLFTQWGAEFTPKIIADINNKTKKIFGWEVRADSSEYKDFLNSFIPELIKVIDELKIKDKTFFHISDEPNNKNIKGYSNAKSLLEDLLKDFTIIDALSDYEFYKRGIVKNPVVRVDHIDTFIENKVENLWVYTCCSPENIYPNRFMAMPSGRNRILGVLMYKNNIKGYLHWGLNFYNTLLSKSTINPYITTDAGARYPSGDAFSLYPYKDGAIPSIRSRVFFDAMQDIRALQLLEELIGRDETTKLIDKYNINSFSCYNRNYDDLLKLRQEINYLIAENI